MPDPIQISEYRLSRATAPRCLHQNITLDPYGDIVRCNDCGHEISAFWYLSRMRDAYRNAVQALIDQAEAISRDRAALEKERAEFEALKEGNAAAAEGLLLSLGGNRACRVCGCTDDDCSGCIERTGAPCWWVDADLCSACAGSTSDG